MDLQYSNLCTLTEVLICEWALQKVLWEVAASHRELPVTQSCRSVGRKGFSSGFILQLDWTFTDCKQVLWKAEVLLHTAELVINLILVCVDQMIFSWPEKWDTRLCFHRVLNIFVPVCLQAPKNLLNGKDTPYLMWRHSCVNGLWKWSLGRSLGLTEVRGLCSHDAAAATRGGIEGSAALSVLYGVLPCSVFCPMQC